METAQDIQHCPPDRNDFVKDPFWKALTLPGALFLFSWGIIGWAFLTGRNVLIDHDYLLRTSRLPWMIALVLFLVCWQVMILAMMVPSLFSRLLVLYTAHEKPGRAQVLFLVGYASVWTLFALLAFVGDTFVHQVVRSWLWLYLHSQLIGACTLALAGLVQWSPMKQRCLQCSRVKTNVQAPISQQSLTSWQQGWRYGQWCLGSNWALMLLMFGIGMRSIVVIALLTALMGVEREMPTGVRFRLVSGGLLLTLALLWYALPLPSLV